MSSLWKFAQIWSLRRTLPSSSLHMFSKNLLRVWQFIFLNIKYFLSILIPPHSVGQVDLAGSPWNCKHWVPCPIALLTCQGPTKHRAHDLKPHYCLSCFLLLSCWTQCNTKVVIRKPLRNEKPRVVNHAFHAPKSYEAIAELLCSGKTHIL